MYTQYKVQANAVHLQSNGMGQWREQLEFEQCKPTAGTTAAAGMLMSKAHVTSRLNKGFMI